MNRVWRLMLPCGVVLGALLVALVPGCGKSSQSGGNGDTGNGGSGDDGGSNGPVVTQDPGVPDGGPATVDPNPTNPKDDNGGQPGWATAPLLDGVQIIPNRDSAVIVVPAVQGAGDYRVLLIPGGVSVSVDGSGGEVVNGSTIFCAGYRQHSAPAGPREVLRQIEVRGLTADTRVVVEAIDKACPYTGLTTPVHGEVKVNNGAHDVPASDAVSFSLFTEDEVRQKYGSLIINGHGAGPQIGLQAAPVNPKVLARTTIHAVPTGNGAPIGETFFDDFSDEDQPKLLENRAQDQLVIYQNSKWSFYMYEAEPASQIYMARKALHVVLADGGQDIFASNSAYPKKPVQLSATDYLHVTWEVASMATQRRYWWISLCGSDQPGQTMTADGKINGLIKQTPFFMDNDGEDPSKQGWNCFQIFPRGGFPLGLPPNNKGPETEIRVMVNKTSATTALRSSVVNLSPMQYPKADTWIAPSWYRTSDSTGQPKDIMIDDQQLASPRGRFDLYLKRDRAILYVNGQQKICNDFPATPLTMAEAALGFGQVLYHSTAERQEMSASYWDRRGMYYIWENVPYVDQRVWDNLGYGEHVQAPPSFDQSVCYKP